jgi:hypothetical protein
VSVVGLNVSVGLDVFCRTGCVHYWTGCLLDVSIVGLNVSVVVLDVFCRNGCIYCWTGCVYWMCLLLD